MSADDSLRGAFFDVLIQLAVKSSIVPKCLEVDGIQEIATFPITSGGFGDVWKAKWRSRAVALKTVRIAILLEHGKETVHRVGLCALALS